MSSSTADSRDVTIISTCKLAPVNGSIVMPTPECWAQREIHNTTSHSDGSVTAPSQCRTACRQCPCPFRRCTQLPIVRMYAISSFAILQDPEAELEPASLLTAYCAMNCRGEAVLGECSEGINGCCLAATRSLSSSCGVGLPPPFVRSLLPPVSSSCGVGDFRPAMVSAAVPAMAPAAAALVARPGD
jgi:hypothetical protein